MIFVEELELTSENKGVAINFLEKRDYAVFERTYR